MSTRHKQRVPLLGNQCCSGDHSNRYKSGLCSNKRNKVTETCVRGEESDSDNCVTKWSPSNSDGIETCSNLSNEETDAQSSEEDAAWTPSKDHVYCKLEDRLAQRSFINKWSPGNSDDMDTLSNRGDTETDAPSSEEDTALEPSTNRVYCRLEEILAQCNFINKSPIQDESSSKVKVNSRSRTLRIFRLRNNVETDPVAIETDSDSDNSLPDLPDISEVLRKERRKKYSILKFAKKCRLKIDEFLSEYKLETQRRPCVRSLGQMGEFEQKHPEIFARMKLRLEIPDADLYALNNYLCDVYCDALRGDGGPAFIMMQKLEDIVDFVVKLYNEQY